MLLHLGFHLVWGGGGGGKEDRGKRYQDLTLTLSWAKAHFGKMHVHPKMGGHVSAPAKKKQLLRHVTCNCSL